MFCPKQDETNFEHWCWKLFTVKKCSSAIFSRCTIVFLTKVACVRGCWWCNYVGRVSVGWVIECLALISHLVWLPPRSHTVHVCTLHAWLRWWPLSAPQWTGWVCIFDHTVVISMATWSVDCIMLYPVQVTAFKNFDPFSEINIKDKRDVEAILVFLKALYFSISTATLCGRFYTCAQSLHSQRAHMNTLH